MAPSQSETGSWRRSRKAKGAEFGRTILPSVTSSLFLAGDSLLGGATYTVVGFFFLTLPPPPPQAGGRGGLLYSSRRHTGHRPLSSCVSVRERWARATDGLEMNGPRTGSERKEEVERYNGKSPFCFLFPPGGKKWGEALLSILPFFFFSRKTNPSPLLFRVKSLLKIDAHSKK